jgi:hypothetical protein
MDKLSREDLFSLEKYAEIRNDFRARVMSHKENRQLPIGPHATLYFEDRLTMQYQIQEMLRAERIFAAEGIQEELNVYNPLVPDGLNWKATFMIEYTDEKERKDALARLIGVEKKLWMRVAGFESVTPIANEDLERETEDKTSSVHFLRFELTKDMVAALKNGASVAAGISHPEYDLTVDPVPENIRQALLEDLE